MRKLACLIAGMVLMAGSALAQDKIASDYYATSGTNRTLSFTVNDKWIGLVTLKIRAKDSTSTNTVTWYLVANGKTNTVLETTFVDMYSLIPTGKFYFKKDDVHVFSNTQSNYVAELYYAKP